MDSPAPRPDEIVPPPEELLGLGEPRYTAIEVSAATGLDVEEAKQLWRAMGFVVVPENEVYFTEGDLDVLRKLVSFIESGFADLDLATGMTRAMGQSLARVAEAQVDAIRTQLTGSPELLDRIVESEAAVAKDAMQTLEGFLVYVWRRHLADALQRGQVLEPQGAQVELTVGFADLVGFTRLSREVDEAELAEVIERFETGAQEAATEVGARVVKTIGDEVMYVADDCVAGAETLLRLIEATSDNELVEIRAGMAVGALTSYHGDYFGPVVNLASRAARAARPGSVLVSEEMAAVLEERPGYDVKPIPRRRLKGIGSPQLYVLRRAEP